MVLNGGITARGGDGPAYCGGICAGEPGGGSGGAIRLVANDVSGSGTLTATSGAYSGNVVGGHGRIRVEGNSVNLVDPGVPLFLEDLPTFIFPPKGTPSLRAVLLEDLKMNQFPVPPDPHGVIDDPVGVDVNIATTDAVTLEIEAENVPAITTVDVRVVSVSGPTAIVTSTPLDGPDKNGILTATAILTFQPGYSVVQLRAFFGDGGLLLGKAGQKGIGDLKTLNGERIVRVDVGSTLGRGSRTIYTTETGRRIPVDLR